MRPLPVSQCDPNINITSIDHPGDHNPPPEAAGDKPGRFELGVARRNALQEEIYRFDCERRAGEFQNIRNLPALLTKRLTEVRKDPSVS